MQNDFDRQRILGIDPGTNHTGFALVAAKRANPCHFSDYLVADAGVCRANPRHPLMRRTADLHDTMYSLIKEMQPNVCVLEKAFVGVNPQSALKLGQLRGAFISAAARCGIDVLEVAPTTVKKNITGYGHADKESVAQVLKATIGFDRGNLPPDVTDAAAIALSCCMPYQVLAKL